LPFSWSCAAAQLRSRQKKATTVVVAVFVELRCSVAPQQVEEGDDSCCRLLHGATLHYSVAPEEEEEGDGSCRRLLLPLFLTLHKEEEESDGSNAAIVVFFFFVLQHKE
jgi:hypothetical protein